MSTTTRQAWINEGGRVTCAQHGGMALASAIKARPSARTLSTDLDHWTRVTPAMVEEWAEAVGAEAAQETATCETCRIKAMREQDR